MMFPMGTHKIYKSDCLSWGSLRQRFPCPKNSSSHSPNGRTLDIHSNLKITNIAAIPFVITGLAALGTGGAGMFSLNKYRRLPPQTLYDLVIRIDSLLSLGKEGWEIALGQTIDERALNTTVINAEKGRGVFVAVLGSYNRGKSFLLNKLCQINLAVGHLVHTEGISITAAKDRVTNVVFIDTAGTDTAIPKQKLDDKKATEALLREIAIHLSSHIIVVVNRLRATDQRYIRQLSENLKAANRQRTIIIVHNLMDVSSEKDANTIIDYEVKTLFEAVEDTMEIRGREGKSSITFFRSRYSDMHLRHFIMAKDETPAAQIWNEQTIQGIMNILQTATEQRIEVNFIPEMIKFINARLPQLFLDDDNEPNPNQFQIGLHSQKPNIVLTKRTLLQNLNEAPCALKLRPKLAFDDAGYFLGVTTMDKGNWQPTYNLYENEESYFLIIDIAGFSEGSPSIQVSAELVTVSGSRADLKGSRQNLVTLQDQISIGNFKLEIRFNQKIDPQKATLVRDNGFFRITCAKERPVIVDLH